MTWDELPLINRALILAYNTMYGNPNRLLLVEQFNLDKGYQQWLLLFSLMRGQSELDLLSDKTYDYSVYYYNNPTDAWKILLGNPDNHLTDIGKTEIHPTASDESLAITDPNWLGRWEGDNIYYLSNNRAANPDLVDETLDYVGSDKKDHGVLVRYPDGSIALPLLIVRPSNPIYPNENPNYTELRRNIYNDGWVYSDRDNTFGKGGKKESRSYNPDKLKVFLEDYDKAWKGTKYDTPEWRAFWTLIAHRESKFNPQITNSIGAKGYFLLMPFNRSATWKDNLQQFREAAKVMDYIENSLTLLDIEKGLLMGFDKWALLAGAWLGGPGGVKKTLNGKRVNDKIYKYTVLDRMLDFSNMPQSALDFNILLTAPLLLETQEVLNIQYPLLDETLGAESYTKLPYILINNNTNETQPSVVREDPYLGIMLLINAINTVLPMQSNHRVIPTVDVAPRRDFSFSPTYKSTEIPNISNSLFKYFFV